MQTDAAAPPWLMAGEGAYSALLVTLAVDRALTTTILPRGLSLAPQSLTAPGTHPMILAFGNQSNVRPIAARAFDLSYSEFIHAIPFVQACKGTSCRGPFIYSPRLYLDRPLPVAL